MSISISNLILHQVRLDEAGQLQVHLRESLLEHNPVTEELVAQLHQIFNAKPSKGFAQFHSDSLFQNALHGLRHGEQDFYTFSQQTLMHLKNELTQYPFADEGVFVLAEYRSLATEHLFIGFLSPHTSLKVTNQLDICATDCLDLSKMDVAARIDLSDYESNPQSQTYLSFVKGRVGRKVSDFFLDFLQAETSFEAKAQNQVLVQALDDYCAENQLDKEDRQSIQQKAFEYCQTQHKNQDFIDVKSLSEALPDDNFWQYTQEQNYDLQEQFPSDLSSLKKLTKYSGSGGGISLQFESHLLNERIQYDPENDTLTIIGIPPNLKDQLNRGLPQ